MRSDRYTKVVLTIIAFALCVIALPRLETPEVMAASRHPLETAVEAETGSAGPGPAAIAEPREAATSTKPLRWRVMNAYHDQDSLHSICGTVVSIRNVAAAAVSVDVEWFNSTAGSEGLSTRTVPSGHTEVFWTNTNLQLDPFLANGASAQTADFYGWANVYANDPRVLASAVIVCRDSDSYLASVIEAMVNVPTFPVGATMEFFQAGMPATWTPPMAAPEVPE